MNAAVATKKHLFDEREVQGSYDALYASVHDNILWGNKPSHLINKVLEHRNRGSVLDLGCGDGVNAHFFEKSGFDVIGIDISALAINGLNNRFSRNATPIRGHYSLKDLNYGYSSSDKYDVIVSCGLFQCLDSQNRIDIHKSLVDNLHNDGIIIFSTLTSVIPLAKSHCTEGLKLAEEYEIDDIFGDFEVLYKKKGIIEDVHAPLVDAHQHSITWIMARKKLNRVAGFSPPAPR